MKKIMLLSKYFNNKIFTRSTISLFFEKLKKLKEDKIVLDFRGIDFISRSCADEYLKLKEKLKSKSLAETNMSEEVCLMFKVVEIQYQNLGIVSSINNSIKNNCSVYA